jgi:hypothetical protein
MPDDLVFSKHATPAAARIVGVVSAVVAMV